MIVSTMTLTNWCNYFIELMLLKINLKNILQSNPNEDAAKLIAAVIIERLAATKEARARFAATNNTFEDEDGERL